MKHSLAVSIVFFTCLSFGRLSWAGVLTILPSQDAAIYEDPNGLLANGSGQHFVVGKNNRGEIRRSLLKFDIAAFIPAQSIINNVTLTLFISRTHAGPQSITMHRLTTDWGEGPSDPGGNEGGGGASQAGDATWRHRFYDTDLWTALGGDFDPAVHATLSLDEEEYYTFTSNSQLVADVQWWLDNPVQNFGWILIGNEAAAATSKRFDSRQNENLALRPRLTINFTPAQPCTDPIRSDLNFDCVVNLADFAILAAQWLLDTTVVEGLGSISIDNVGTFPFDPAEISTVRPDIFTPSHFSIFDILVHLHNNGAINMQYHFDSTINTHVIDSINGIGNWWHRAYYDGGWNETNVYRIDHYPYKEGMYLNLYESNSSHIQAIHAAFLEELQRKQTNGSAVIIPEVIIRGKTFQQTFQDVLVQPHNLRSDVFQPGVITGIDAILSLADQGRITYALTWYDSIGTAQIVRSYWVQQINDDLGSGRCGFVYECGDLDFRGIGNHIHIPSDFRPISSPEYMEWFWIELGPCQ